MFFTVNCRFDLISITPLLYAFSILFDFWQHFFVSYQTDVDVMFNYYFTLILFPTGKKLYKK